MTIYDYASILAGVRKRGRLPYLPPHFLRRFLVDFVGRLGYRGYA